jgi:hypothetical protein
MADRDPSFGAGRHIDVVEPNCELGDHSQLSCCFEQRSINAIRYRTKEPFSLGNEKMELLLRDRLGSRLLPMLTGRKELCDVSRKRPGYYVSQ